MQGSSPEKKQAGLSGRFISGFYQLGLKELCLLQAEETALTDEIKAYMGDEETMICGTCKVTYKEVASKRVDTSALRRLLGEEALAPYTKIVVTRRFAIN